MDETTPKADQASTRDLAGICVVVSHSFPGVGIIFNP